MKKLLFTLLFVVTSLFALDNATHESKTSADGKYTNLLQILECPQDGSTYGEFNDYGYWGGGMWCGQQGRAGYWVWVNPKWYIWGDKSQNLDSSLQKLR